MNIHPIHRFLARAPKPLRPPACRFLYGRLLPRLALDPGLFTGRRVLIVGPARTVEDDLSALDPDRFDLVVRMNNGLDTPVRAMGANPYRCEVLFHSLTADARPVTDDNLRRAGVKTVVHRTPKRGAFLRTLAFRDRLDPAIDLRIVPVDRYHALSQQLGGHSPTTGLVCASVILEAKPQALAICGFTFFSTRYIDRYDDADRSDADTVRRIRDTGHHDPGQEAQLLMAMVDRARARGVEVILGAGVQQAAAAMADQPQAGS
ncbi:hypothetical protein [Paracoccus sp. SSK6]|uniref:hypothetical protein n=1 Tax=Paracoccus sp. SSK6 TaxID=3143131 RepID=UPI00321A49C6